MEVETVHPSSHSEPSSPKSSASSSFPSPLIVPRLKYDVFLNFRGEDTRLNFMGHLRAALYSKGLEIFIDDDQLEKGGSISPQLLEAIEDSRCAIVLFSENYASSTWCLDELVKILDCMKHKGQIVIPVFFHADPSDVRKQTGRFGEAFAKHERNLREHTEKVESWREALREATGLAGLDLRNYRDEANFIRVIVEEVSRKVSSAKASKEEDNHPFFAGVWEALQGLLFCLFSLFVVFPLFALLLFKVVVPMIFKIAGAP